MAKTFIVKRNSDGTTETDPINSPKMRYFPNMEAAQEAFNNGTLQVGEVVTIGEGNEATHSDATLPIGTIVSYFSNTIPTGWLLCDGAEFDVEKYPVLYSLLQDNHTPDLRETALVGAGENTTNEIGAHDIYEIGEFKDDQVQEAPMLSASSASIPSGETSNIYNNGGSNRLVKQYQRMGSVTRGKRTGVNFIIKAVYGEVNEEESEVITDFLTDMKSHYIPDYARGNLFPFRVSSWEVPEDCWVNYRNNANTDGYGLMIDGQLVSTVDAIGGVYNFQFSGYVKKGSVLSSQWGGTINSCLNVWGLTN